MGRHFNAAYRVCIDWDKTIIVRVGKNSGPVLSRLWTKVHEILRQRRSVLARLSMSRFVSRYSLLSLEVGEKPNKCKILAPIFFDRDDPNFSTTDC